MRGARAHQLLCDARVHQLVAINSCINLGECAASTHRGCSEQEQERDERLLHDYLHRRNAMGNAKSSEVRIASEVFAKTNRRRTLINIREHSDGIGCTTGPIPLSAVPIAP